MDHLISMEKAPRGVRDMRYALDTVYLSKVLRDHRLLYLYEEWPSSPEFVGDIGDYEPDVIYHATLSLTEAVWEHYSEHLEMHTMYFSHPAMMEYYRLCREYGRIRNIPLRDNPFMNEAARYVSSQLDQGCYSCEYFLQTKVNHKWASGIVFRMWPEFSGHIPLLILMAKIFRYYERELMRLKAELAENENTNQKEAA